MRGFFLLPLLAASCVAPECRYGTTADAQEMTQDPARLHEYFLDQVRCGSYSNAYNYCLTKEARGRLSYEQFYFVVQWEIVRRMILGFEQDAVAVAPDRRSAEVDWRNREFGVSRTYRLVGQRIGRTKVFWGIDFTSEQLEELKDAAFAWFRKQKEIADNKLYAYPPDWRYSPVGR